MAKYNFEQMAEGKYKDNRIVVVSKATNEDGTLAGYAVSEKVVFDDNGKKTTMFMKNGLGVVSENGLRILKDTIDKVLAKLDGSEIENHCCDCNCGDNGNK